MHPQNGCFFIRVVTFTDTIVYSVIRNQSPIGVNYAKLYPMIHHTVLLSSEPPKSSGLPTPIYLQTPMRSTPYRYHHCFANHTTGRLSESRNRSRIDAVTIYCATVLCILDM